MSPTPALPGACTLYLHTILMSIVNAQTETLQNPKMLFFAIIMMCIKVSIEADCRSVIFENDLGKKKNFMKGSCQHLVFSSSE